MAGTSVAKASEIFTKFRSAKTWVFKTCPNGTKITYVNKCNSTIEKLVGTPEVFRSFFVLL